MGRGLLGSVEPSSGAGGLGPSRHAHPQIPRREPRPVKPHRSVPRSGDRPSPPAQRLTPRPQRPWPSWLALGLAALSLQPALAPLAAAALPAVGVASATPQGLPEWTPQSAPPASAPAPLPQWSAVAAAQPSSPPQAEASPALAPPAPDRSYSAKEFAWLLDHGSLEQLEVACQRVYANDQLDRLRRIREIGRAHV